MANGQVSRPPLSEFSGSAPVIHWKESFLVDSFLSLSFESLARLVNSNLLNLGRVHSWSAVSLNCFFVGCEWRMIQRGRVISMATRVTQNYRQ